MKKILIVMMLTLVSRAVFSDSILTLDGNEWTTMDKSQKEHLIAGMLLGFEVVRLAAIENRVNSDVIIDDEGRTVDDYVSEFAEYFFLDQNVPYLVSYLDKFYRTPSNRQYTVWSNVLIACDRDWW